VTDAAASPAGDLLGDRELSLIRVMDCAHTGRIDRQERLGNASHAPWMLRRAIPVCRRPERSPS
jgi:hypothetical protein